MHSGRSSPRERSPEADDRRSSDTSELHDRVFLIKVRF